MNIHEMKKLASAQGPINILDVGCGEANTIRLFYTADQSRKRDVIESYLGLDGDSGVIKKTNEKAATVLRGVNGSLEVCDITKGKFPVEPGSIDFVICNEVLEHIPGEAVPKVLKAMRRAVHPDSVLMISTPNKDGTNDKLPADHVKEWGYQELMNAFAEAGFVVVDQMATYIKKDRLVRYLRENDPDLVEWAQDIWARFGNDLGSMMTADWAVPVANNIVWKVQKA
jgi:2-polyprenyl-3-methyl-5-hydroxy-6-metoxy-1,4-benzoquinol methylase